MLQRRDLLIQQVVGLVYQTYNGVGHDRRITMLQPGSVGLPMLGRIKIPVLVGLAELPADGAYPQSFSVIFEPLTMAVLAQIVLEVQQ